MIDFETLKKEYDEKGVIVIPNVFTAEECDLIKKNAYSVNDLDITKSKSTKTYPDYLVNGEVINQIQINKIS